MTKQTAKVIHKPCRVCNDPLGWARFCEAWIGGEPCSHGRRERHAFYLCVNCETVTYNGRAVTRNDLIAGRVTHIEYQGGRGVQGMLTSRSAYKSPEYPSAASVPSADRKTPNTGAKETMTKKTVIKKLATSRVRTIAMSFSGLSVSKTRATLNFAVSADVLTPEEARHYLLNAQLTVSSIVCKSQGDVEGQQHMEDSGTDDSVEIRECIAECTNFNTKPAAFTGSLRFVKSSVAGMAAEFFALAGREGKIKVKRTGDVDQGGDVDAEGQVKIEE